MVGYDRPDWGMERYYQECDREIRIQIQEEDLLDLNREYLKALAENTATLYLQVYQDEGYNLQDFQDKDATAFVDWLLEDAKDEGELETMKLAVKYREDYTAETRDNLFKLAGVNLSFQQNLRKEDYV